MVDRLFRALGRGVVRYRWVIVVVWLLGTVGAMRALPSLGSQVNNNNSAFLPANAPSNQAANLAEPLTGPVNQTLVQVVAVSSRGPLGPGDQAALQALSVSLRRVPTVDLVQFAGVSPDRKAAQVLVLSKNSMNDISGDKTLLAQMQAIVHRAALPPGMQVHFAGVVATAVANQVQSVAQGKQTQTLSLLLIIVLLLFIFRSVVAPLLTLFPAAVVLVLSQSLIGGLGSVGLKISQVTQLLLIVLVLGAGTDYGLFLVFRVREEMERAIAPTRPWRSPSPGWGSRSPGRRRPSSWLCSASRWPTSACTRISGRRLPSASQSCCWPGLTLLPALIAIVGSGHVLALQAEPA